MCSRHFGVLLRCFTHCLRVVYFLDLAQPRRGSLESGSWTLQGRLHLGSGELKAYGRAEVHGKGVCTIPQKSSQKQRGYF